MTIETPSRARDHGPAGVILRFLAVAGLLVVGLLAAAPPVAAVELATGPACASVAQGGTARVALVVDYGDVAGSPGRVDTFCVPVSGRVNGFDVLQTAGVSFRVDGSGLVCGLGGYPAPPECGQPVGDRYRYWAYFRGTASGWQYRNIGPGASYPGDGVVEGWRFVEATDGTAPPPRHSSAFAGICAAVTTTTRAPAPTTTARPAPPAPAAPSTTVAGAPASTAPDPTTAVPPADDASSTTAPDPDAPAGTAPADGSGPAGTTAGDDPADGEEAAGDLALSELDDDGSGSAVPAALGVGAIVALGALAAVRFARSGGGEP